MNKNFSLSNGSHKDVVSYNIIDNALTMTLGDSSTTRLQNIDQYIGYQGDIKLPKCILLMNNNWTGLVLDGSEKNVEQIKSSDYYWKYDLIAKTTFVTAENINKLIENEGINGVIGLLHIDMTRPFPEPKVKKIKIEKELTNSSESLTSVGAIELEVKE